MKGFSKATLVGMVFFGLFSLRAKAEELHADRPLPPNIKRIVEENHYPPFVRECFGDAVTKLKEKAAAQKAVLKKETIKVESIDDRWYSFSKYVWFSATVERPEGDEKIIVMMQKPFKGACF